MNPLSMLRIVPKSFSTHFSVRWALLALAAAAVIGTAGYSYHNINRELTAVAMSRREAVAQLMAVTLSDEFGRAMDIATSLATRVHFREFVAQGKWQQAIKIMQHVPRDFPLIDRLFIADTSGTKKADEPTLPGARGVNFANQDWYQGVSRNWQPYISPLYKRASIPQLNVIAIAAPVRTPAGKVVGILVLQIHIENLLKWIDKIHLGNDAFVYIVDSKGQVVFDSRHRGSENIINLSATPIVQKLRHSEHGSEIGYDAASKSESIVAHAALPDYGWGVVVQQPVRSSLGLAARDTQLRQLLTGYGIILLFGILTVIMTLRISNARRKAESDARFVMIVNTATDAIISVDQEQNIVLFNHSAELIFGYSAAEMLGQPLDRLLPAQVSKIHRRHVQNFASVTQSDEAGRHMTQGREISGKRKDGTEFPAEASIAKSIADEQLTLTVILRDVSERKQAESQIRELNEDLERKVTERTHELAAANKELEAFSYSVSHDLRAPLRSIDGFSQALLEDYGEGMDEQAKGYLNRVRNATQRMGLLIDDMLILSRVTRVNMRRESADLSALAAEVRDELCSAEPGRDVDWRIEPGLIAQCDIQLLRVVLVNLMGNAYKFTMKTKNAIIEIGAILSPAGSMEFFVRDNGAGFDMAYADKLFGAFQRLHLASEFYGTGIGLATVQRIVHRHGGQVRGEGIPGQGATFYFTLPD